MLTTSTNEIVEVFAEHFYEVTKADGDDYIALPEYPQSNINNNEDKRSFAGIKCLI